MASSVVQLFHIGAVKFNFDDYIRNRKKKTLNFNLPRANANSELQSRKPRRNKTEKLETIGDVTVKCRTETRFDCCRLLSINSIITFFFIITVVVVDVVIHKRPATTSSRSNKNDNDPPPKFFIYQLQKCFFFFLHKFLRFSSPPFLSSSPSPLRQLYISFRQSKGFFVL